MGRPPYEPGYTVNSVNTGGGGKRSPRVCYVPSSKWTWSFSLVALAQCIISLALEAYVFAKYQSSLHGHPREEETGDGKDDAPATATLTIPTYLALFIFGFLYELVLVWDALRLKNTIQVIGICLYNVGMLIYAGVEMSQVDDAVGVLVAHGNTSPKTWSYLRPFLIAAPCVIALGTVLLSLIAWKLYDEFAWTIYKHISADLRLKRRYLTYQIYIALLKFDFFFFLGFTVQFLVVVQDTTHDAEFYLTIVALPITVLLLLLAAYLVRRESPLGHLGIIILYFAAMAYFVFKLVRMYDSNRETAYAPVRRSLTTFASLTLGLLVVTIGTAGAVMRNFGKGLRPHIQDWSGRGRRGGGEVEGKFGEGDVSLAHQLGDVPSSRMTID